MQLPFSTEPSMPATKDSPPNPTTDAPSYESGASDRIVFAVDMADEEATLASPVLPFESPQQSGGAAHLSHSEIVVLTGHQFNDAVAIAIPKVVASEDSEAPGAADEVISQKDLAEKNSWEAIDISSRPVPDELIALDPPVPDAGATQEFPNEAALASVQQSLLQEERVETAISVAMKTAPSFGSETTETRVQTASPQVKSDIQAVGAEPSLIEADIREKSAPPIAGREASNAAGQSMPPLSDKPLSLSQPHLVGQAGQTQDKERQSTDPGRQSQDQVLSGAVEASVELDSVSQQASSAAMPSALKESVTPMVMPHPGSDTAEPSSLDLPIEAEHVNTSESRRAETATLTTIAQRPETQRAMIAQLAQVQLSPDRPVELRLDPQELGQVRMILSSQDQTLTLVMSAERSETLELMRRNIDELAQEFQAMGYTDLNFSFAEQGPSDHKDEPRPKGAADKIETIEPEAHTQILALGARGGLDLRL